MLVPASSETPSLIHFGQDGASVVATRLELWRQDRCSSDCQRPTMALCWVLALCLTCLSVGLIGLTAPIKQPIKLLTLAAATEGEENTELAMLEMSAPLAEESPDTTESQTTLEIPLPEPDFLPELTPPSLEDFPELTQVLTAEDLFTVPTAAPVEEMLKPQPETSRRPDPAPAPAPAPRARTSPTTTSRSATSGSTATGGSGGTGTSARGSSKGFFPAPPYPAAARSRGLQGTVYLSITFGADGRVTAASVSRSSGYSDLDRAASDWVRRNWRAPTGQTGTYRQPVQFRLR